GVTISRMAEPRREIGPHFVSCGVRGHHFYRVDDWSPQEGEAFSRILGPSACEMPRHRSTPARGGTQGRILLPLAQSLLRTSLSGRIPSKNRRSESSPLGAIAPEDAAVAPG